MRRSIWRNRRNECLWQSWGSLSRERIYKSKLKLISFHLTEFLMNPIRMLLCSSVVKRMPSALPKNWIIVGLVAVQFMQNYHQLLIFVKLVVVNTKWVNAPDLDFVISCIWNRFQEICAGKINLEIIIICFHTEFWEIFVFLRYLYSRRRSGRSRSRSPRTERSPPKRTRDRRRSRSRDRKGRY